MLSFTALSYFVAQSSQNPVNEIYFEQFHEVIQLKFEDSPAAIFAVFGMFFFLLAIALTTLEISASGIRIKIGGNKTGTCLSLFAAAVCFAIGVPPWFNPISPGIAVPYIHDKYEEEPSTAITKLWNYGRDILASQNSEVKRDSDEIFIKISSLSSSQEIPQLINIAKALSSVNEHASAGIIYKRIADLSNLQDVGRLRDIAQEVLENKAEISNTEMKAAVSDNAATLYRRIVDLSSNQNLEQLQGIVQTLLDEGETENALIIQAGIVSILERTESVSGESKSEAQLRYGVSLMKLDRNDDAIKSFNEAAKHGSNEFAANSYLCQAYYRIERFDDALSSCNKALKIDPGEDELRRAKAWYSRGLVLDVKGPDSDALESYLFAYSIVSTGKSDEDIKKLERDNSVESAVIGRLSDRERESLRVNFNSLNEEDLEKLIRDEMSQYNSSFTANILSLIAFSETPEGISVLAKVSQESDDSTIIKDSNDDSSTGDIVVSLDDLPQQDCGEFYNSQSDEPRDPDKFYAVTIENNERDALIIEEKFCKKPWPRPDGRLQVASFYSESVARQFKELLEEQFGEARVGLPDAE